MPVPMLNLSAWQARPTSWGELGYALLPAVSPLLLGDQRRKALLEIGPVASSRPAATRAQPTMYREIEADLFSRYVQRAPNAKRGGHGTIEAPAHTAQGHRPGGCVPASGRTGPTATSCHPGVLPDGSKGPREGCCVNPPRRHCYLTRVYPSSGELAATPPGTHWLLIGWTETTWRHDDVRGGV